MITFSEAKWLTSGKLYFVGECLSTDEKPTETIQNGSKLMEMDTATMYLYDAENERWRPWNTTAEPDETDPDDTDPDDVDPDAPADDDEQNEQTDENQEG